MNKNSDCTNFIETRIQRSEQLLRNRVAAMSNTAINNIKESRTTGIDANGKEVVQDFYQLREELFAKKTDCLFEDPTFPADVSSIFPDGIPDKLKKLFNNIVWKRPGEITDNPQFFVDGVSRFDVQQTYIGNCWALASLSSLAMHPRLLFQVVPQDQDFEDTNYAGIFHFRFWQFGKWVDVVIDDRLPTNSESKLLLAQSTERNEFWIPLVEKAYAKLYGSWMAIGLGNPSEALEDFTGGLAFPYEFADAGGVSFHTLQYAQKRNALMVCVTYPKQQDKKAIEREMARKQIFPSHAYSMTQVVNYRGNELLRLRNPWGRTEWTGQFSDKDEVWKRDEDMCKALDFKADDDGEFFMPYAKAHNYFSLVNVCYVPILGNDGKKLEEKAFEGKWGRREAPAKDTDSLDSEAEIMSKNMQFRITLENPDTEDGKCTVTVALMQKNRRKKRAKNLSMGVSIYHLADPDELSTPLTADFLNEKNNQPVSGSVELGLRELCCVIKLKPGTYCVIPFLLTIVEGAPTLTCNEEEEFLLRLFLGNIPNVEEAIMHVKTFDG